MDPTSRGVRILREFRKEQALMLEGHQQVLQRLVDSQIEVIWAMTSEFSGGVSRAEERIMPCKPQQKLGDAGVPDFDDFHSMAETPKKSLHRLPTAVETFGDSMLSRGMIRSLDSCLAETVAEPPTRNSQHIPSGSKETFEDSVWCVRGRIRSWDTVSSTNLMAQREKVRLDHQCINLDPCKPQQKLGDEGVPEFDDIHSLADSVFTKNSIRSVPAGNVETFDDSMRSVRGKIRNASLFDTISPTNLATQREKVRRDYKYMNEKIAQANQPHFRRMVSRTMTRQSSRMANSMILSKSLSLSTWHDDRMEMLITSKLWQVAVCLLIALDALLVGVNTARALDDSIEAFNVRENDVSGNYEIESGHFFIEVSISALFVVELLSRIGAFGCRRFFGGLEFRWNWLDALLVSGSCIELTLRTLNISLSWIRTLRMLRMLRALRMVRIIRFAMVFRHLRLMTLAIMHSAVPLMWAVVFVIFVTWLFGIIFVQGISDFIASAPGGNTVASDMREYFASMPMSLLTLFMVISNGISWWVVAQLLLECSAFYVVLLLCYVVIMLFAAMNIITGIFVNEALEMANWDKALVEQTEREKTSETMRTLQALFLEADIDEDGQLTAAELEVHIERDDVRAIFTTLGLQVSDARGFFKMLDVEGTGAIEIDEFVMGCMRFRGPAKTVDLENLIHENKRMMVRLREDTLEFERSVLSYLTQIHKLRTDNQVVRA